MLSIEFKIQRDVVCEVVLGYDAFLTLPWISYWNVSFCVLFDCGPSKAKPCSGLDKEVQHSVAFTSATVMPNNYTVNLS